MAVAANLGMAADSHKIVGLPYPQPLDIVNINSAILHTSISWRDPANEVLDVVAQRSPFPKPEARPLFWRVVDHPRTSLVAGLAVAGAAVVAPPHPLAVVLGLLAAFLILRSAYEWAPIGQRLPFALQSPIIWLASQPKPARPVTELGWLDNEKSHLAATAAATKTLGDIGKEMERNNPEIVASGEEMLRLRGADVDKRLRATNKAGSIIDGHASRLERLERTYRHQCAQMTEGLVGMLKLTPAETDLGTFPDAVAGTIRGTRGSTDSLRQYRASVQQVRNMRISQRVNEASDHLLGVLDLLINDNQVVLSAFTDAKQVMDERWPKS